MIVRVYGDVVPQRAGGDAILVTVRKRHCQVRDCGADLFLGDMQTHMDMYHEGQDAEVWSDPVLIDPWSRRG